MKSFVFWLCTLALAGCSGGGSDNTPTVTIDGVSTTTSVDRTDLYNLIISGTSTDVTVKKNNTIKTLMLGGTSNMLTIESDVTVETFNATGVSGNAYVPIGSGIGFDSDSGVGNDLIEY